MADIAQIGFAVDTTGLRRGEAALNRLGAAGTKTNSTFTRIRQSVLSLQGALASIGTGLAIRKTLRDFAEFENRLVSIGKTTGLAGAELDRLGSQVQDIARSVPLSTNRLLDLGIAAGQIGVSGVDNIAKFVDTLGRLEISSDLAGEAGARSLGRLINITGESVSNIDRLGSSIVALGNNLAATEQEITNAATFLASSTAQFGLTAAEVVGLSGALVALGQRAETSGSAVGAAMVEIDNAIGEGGKNLETLLNLTEMTRQEFVTLFADSAPQALAKFTAALNELPSQEQTKILEDFNLAGRETRRVILAMASGFETLSNALDMSSTEWDKNTALLEESIVASESFSSQIQLAKNALDEIAVTIGRELAPVIVDMLSDFRQWVSDARNIERIRQYARDAGDAFAYMAEHAETLANVLMIIVGIRLGASFGIWGAAIGGLAGAFTALVTSTDDAKTSLEGLTKSEREHIEAVKEHTKVIGIRIERTLQGQRMETKATLEGVRDRIQALKTLREHEVELQAGQSITFGGAEVTDFDIDQFGGDVGKAIRAAQDEVDRLQDKLLNLDKQIIDSAVPIGGDGGAVEPPSAAPQIDTKAIEEYEKALESIRNQADPLRELTLDFAAAQNTLDEALFNGDVTAREYNEIMNALTQQYQEVKGDIDGTTQAQQKYNDSLKELMGEVDPMLPALEQFDESMKLLNQAVQAGDISWQEYTKAVEHIQDRLTATQDSITGMDRFMQQAGQSVDDYFFSWIEGTQTASEALRGFVIELGKAALKQMIFQQTAGATSSIGGFALQALGGLFAGGASVDPAAYRMQVNPHAGFADGGDFMVGGQFPEVNAGRDNRLVTFAARDGERVSVSTPGKKSNSMGGAEIVNNITIDARGADAGVEQRINEGIARALPQITQASLQRVVDERNRNPRLFGGR